MKTIELDLTGCKYSGEIHERIKTAFDFPEWYGANWDAFWDLLWSECDAEKVFIKGESTLPKEFNSDILKLHEALDRNVQFCRENSFSPFSYEVIS